MKSKQNQLAHLGDVLLKLKSGLYLVDTELDENDIEYYINRLDEYSFNKEELIPSLGSSPFELLVIALCRQFECEELNRQRYSILGSRGSQKENLIYDTLISIVKILSKGKSAILLLYGEVDLCSFKHEELAKLNYAVTHHGIKTIVLSKLKNTDNKVCDKLITQIKLNSIYNMGNRKYKVHITYKHNDAHKSGIEAIKVGLDTHKIPYSIDEYDILYRDNIQEYEDEIGMSNVVIMFVIPEYLKSLDCMYEMTQLFKNGNVRQRVFPVVDMGDVPRNGDGLTQIKKYWQDEKSRKLDIVHNEPGSSGFLLEEIVKIDNILKTLDDFWKYVVHTNTGSYEDMIANNAEDLIKAMEKNMNISSFADAGNFIPSYATEPGNPRRIVHQGDKAVYVEKNEGTINIS